MKSVILEQSLRFRGYFLFSFTFMKQDLFDNSVIYQRESLRIETTFDHPIMYVFHRPYVQQLEMIHITR